MRRILTLDETRRLRRTPGATLLLFLTDRCPVGCAHCSVSSRVDSPAIEDFSKLDEMLAGICALGAVEAVAISGGEPFVERRGLIRAVERISAAGKAIIIFTSGSWAAGDTTAGWVRDILSAASAVFLGWDSFHEAGISQARVDRAIRAVAAAGCRLILQTLDDPASIDTAKRALTRAFGPAWVCYSDLHVVKPLSTGRGAGLFAPPREHQLTSFGPCRLLGSPTIRYDGVVTPCCNEAVITGRGPLALHRRVYRADEVASALAAFQRTPLLRILASYGPRAFGELPGMEPLAEARAATVCEACWAAHAVTARDSRAAASAVALASLLGDKR